MRFGTSLVRYSAAIALFCWVLNAQQTTTLPATAVVPRLVNYSGKVTDAEGKVISGITGVTFAIYKDQYEGAPLWIETQNIQPDARGNYTVQLGATTPEGLPLDVFTSGEARWLGVRINGGEEHPRVLLLSVPYALKAADADTLGGLPASAYRTVNSENGTQAGAALPANGAQAGNKGFAQPNTITGTKNYVAKFADTKNDLGNSEIYDNGTNVGIGTTSPRQKLEVDLGNALVRGANNFHGSGDTADLYVGDTSHLVSATWGGGLALGAYKVPQALFVQDGTGYVGIGTTAPLYTLDVRGRVSATDNELAARAISGYASSPTGGAVFGVLGATDSGDPDAAGVEGIAEPESGDSVGVYGWADATGVGVFGQYDVPSDTSANWVGDYAAGVWGDGGNQTYNSWVGVFGTADTNNAGIFVNNSSSAYTVYLENDDAHGYPLGAFNFSNNTYCNVDSSGNLNCTGAKHAIVPVDGGNRMVAMSAIESPQNWFEDAGSSHLTNGTAVVTIDPTFIETVNTEMEYQVFLTPYGECKGLYVTDRTRNSFLVHDLGGGTSSIAFGYRIMALRKNYEDIRFADHTRDREMMQAAIARRSATPSPGASHAPKKAIRHVPARVSLSSAAHNNP